MEVQIQELLDKINEEGIARAEKSAAEIISAAEKKAAALVAEARNAAAVITAEAKSDAAQFQATGKQAVIQAGRDLLLNVRSSLSRIFSGLIEKEIKSSLDITYLKSAIVQLVTAWTTKGTDNIEILLPEKEQQQLQDFFMAQLQVQLKKGVSIKASPALTAGFQVMEKSGSAFYDLTDQGLAEALKPFLNARLAACLDEAVQDPAAK